MATPRRLLPLARACDITGIKGRATSLSPSLHSAILTVELFERSQQLIRGGGEVADASTGRVMDRVYDRGACPADTKLADALAAERTAMRIGFVQKHDVHRADIGVHRDMVARQILIDEGAVAQVDVVLLDQRRADPPRHAADHLGSRRLRIEDAAGRKYAEHTSHTHLTRVAIHPQFAELSGEPSDAESGTEAGGR